MKACPIVPAFCIICYWYKLHLFPHKVALCWYIFEGDCHSVRNNLRNSDIDFCGNCYDFDYYGNCYYFDFCGNFVYFYLFVISMYTEVCVDDITGQMPYPPPPRSGPPGMPPVSSSHSQAPPPPPSSQAGE